MLSIRHIPVAIVVAFCCFGESPLVAQWTGEESGAVAKAAKLAEQREYAEAVRLLELALVEGDTSEQLRVDLAAYYKKTGDLRRATALTKPLVDKDRPRPWHLLQVAGMLIDQGRLGDAEPYLRRFEELKPDDPRAQRLRERGLRSRTIKPVYPDAVLDSFAHNTLADENFPYVRRDSSGVPDALLWSSDRDGSGGRSAWTGRDVVGIYGMSLGGDPAAGPAPYQRLEGRFNRGAVNVAGSWLTESGDSLFYAANTTEPNYKGELNMQLYLVTRRRGAEGGEADLGDWRDATRLPTLPEDPSCMHPTLSVDGRWLYYAADASDSRGGLDLYRVALRRDGAWGKPENLGATVNTERHDGFPVAAVDGALYFASQGHDNLGGFDIFRTRQRPDGTWLPPVNLGEPVNGPGDETAWLPVRTGYAYLVSDRVGGDDDIYEVRW